MIVVVRTRDADHLCRRMNLRAVLDKIGTLYRMHGRDVLSDGSSASRILIDDVFERIAFSVVKPRTHVLRTRAPASLLLFFRLYRRTYHDRDKDHDKRDEY